MNTSFNAERILAESEHYKIVSEFECVDLILKSGGRICIGDFYGDPEGAFIDKNEKYCVMYGCGVVIYFLNEPFFEYHYNMNTEQWREFGRRSDNIIWVENARQIDEASFEIVIEDGETKKICITNK